MRMRAINFRLVIEGDGMVSIIEENRENEIRFQAPAILKSEWIEGMLAESLASRIKAIIAEHLKAEA